jgi:predicted kinase
VHRRPDGRRTRDIERLETPARASAFLDAYLEFSGDPAPPALVHHYIAHRAFVRAKGGVSAPRAGRSRGGTLDAGRYTDLALRHLQAAAVRPTLVGGLPGTGKSTPAGALAGRAGAVLLSSDTVRKELAGMDPLTPAAAGYGDGLYSADHTEALYAEVLRRAGMLLARGESVVLDASWTTSASHRRAAAQLAADCARRSGATPMPNQQETADGGSEIVATAPPAPRRPSPVPWLPTPTVGLTPSSSLRREASMSHSVMPRLPGARAAP